jgi:predicted ferric reductase
LATVTDVNAPALPRIGLQARPVRARPSRVPALAIWLVLAANAIAITWLWWHDGNVSAVRTFGDGMTSAGRLTGLLAAYSALVQVVLLARIPWIERVTGFDRLSIWHRRNGHACLYLILAHVVATVIGYAALDKLTIPHEVVSMTTGLPGMVTAWVGTGLLILVAVSSVVIVRRRLPYEAWYAVHILSYAGIALAWFHQIPTGNELVLQPTADAYWNSLFIATLALIVVFRVFVPAAAAFYYRLRVAEVIDEGPGVVSLRITGRRLRRMRARAGQFFLWRFLTRDRWWIAHPFSLSESPDGRSLRITVKALGDHSEQLARIKPGTRVLAEGPLGVFTAAVQRRPRSLLLAGGIGITPIRALLDELHGETVVVYRAIAEDDLVLRDELEQTGATIHYVIGDHSAPGGERLLSPDHLRELVPDLNRREVYLCGPPGMTAALERTLARLRVPRRHLHVERFAL